MEDNWIQQADEIEALSAIFLGQLFIDKGNERTFKVSLIEGTGKHQQSLTLQVEFGPDYPSHAPPIYCIKESQLSTSENKRLFGLLDEIYLDNLGSPIVFLWLDKIREVLINKISDSESIEGCVAEQEETEVYDSFPEDDHAGDSESKSHSSKTDSKETAGNEVQLPTIHHGEFVKDRRSVFQGHLSPVTDKRQVDMVMEKLKENKKIATATHNIIAYRIDCKNGGYVTGCFDDGETHAGSRMLHLLEIVDARNVLVVVTRWYGGVHLGPDRFKHINNCTRDLLQKHGFISEKKHNSKHAPKSQTEDSSNSKSTYKGRRH